MIGTDDGIQARRLAGGDEHAPYWSIDSVECRSSERAWDTGRLLVVLDRFEGLVAIDPWTGRIEPAGFPMAWTDAIQRRFPDYQLSRDQTHNTKEWTFKRWAYETTGAPGITYELGSATSHDLIDRIATGAADEAMQLLLQSADAADAFLQHGRIVATAAADELLFAKG